MSYFSICIILYIQALNYFHINYLKLWFSALVETTQEAHSWKVIFEDYIARLIKKKYHFKTTNMQSDSKKK